jgi:hypothetical protein
LVIKALDPDPYPDPYWYPASTSGFGSGKNEYGSETLESRWKRSLPIEDEREKGREENNLLEGKIIACLMCEGKRKVGIEMSIRRRNRKEKGK